MIKLKLYGNYINTENFIITLVEQNTEEYYEFVDTQGRKYNYYGVSNTSPKKNLIMEVYYELSEQSKRVHDDELYEYPRGIC